MRSTTVFDEDFYDTLKLTGIVYFDGSNGPCGVVLHNWQREYSLGNSATTHGVPPPKGYFGIFRVSDVWAEASFSHRHGFPQIRSRAKLNRNMQGRSGRDEAKRPRGMGEGAPYTSARRRSSWLPSLCRERAPSSTQPRRSTDWN
jgi:hypothetical protein